MVEKKVNFEVVTYGLLESVARRNNTSIGQILSEAIGVYFWVRWQQQNGYHVRSHRSGEIRELDKLEHLKE